MPRITWMVALGLAVFVVGCGAATASEGVVPVDVGVSPLSRAAPQPPEELEDVLSGLSAFGFELYHGATRSAPHPLPS